MRLPAASHMHHLARLPHQALQVAKQAAIPALAAATDGATFHLAVGPTTQLKRRKQRRAKSCSVKVGALSRAVRATRAAAELSELGSLWPASPDSEVGRFVDGV